MYMRGFGASSPTGSAILSGSAAAGSTAVAGLLAAGAITGPVGAAVSAGIALVTTIIGAIMNSGCGPSCVQASNFANQAEAPLEQNIAAYFSLPAPRSTVDQAAALQNFDTYWEWLQQQCGQVGGTAGQNCISDRQAGACKWKVTTPNQWPGQPGVGQCFNWFNGYRDPIANDPNVYTPSATSAVSSTVASVESSLGQYALPVGIAAALLIALAVS